MSRSKYISNPNIADLISSENFEALQDIFNRTNNPDDHLPASPARPAPSIISRIYSYFVKPSNQIQPQTISTIDPVIAVTNASPAFLAKLENAGLVKIDQEILGNLLNTLNQNVAEEIIYQENDPSLPSSSANTINPQTIHHHH